MTNPYAQSAWVYIAISRLAEKIASIPFRISRMDAGRVRKVRAFARAGDARHRALARRALGEAVIEEGDVVELFEHPHPTMPRQLFWEMVITWHCLRGESFILPLDTADQPVDLSDRNPKVSRLIALPPELFWHVVSGYELHGWRYTGSPLLTPIPSEFLLPGEVIHSRTPNPFLYWRGMSPLVVAMTAAGADFAASKYNQGYWLNNADTGVIVTTEQQTTPEQRAAINAALRERKRKAGTADRPLFLWGGAKIEKPTLSGMEATFIENRRMNRQEIGAIFKVPESVMGFSEDKSSALSGGGAAINAEQLQFIESTICPLCCQIESALHRVVESFGEGLVGWFDIDSLPVMQDARRARLDSAVKAFGIGAAFNDVNRVYDLGFPDYEWGNKSFLPFSLQEAGTSPDLPSELPPAGADDTEEKSNPFTRMARVLAGVSQSRATGEVAARAGKAEALWKKHISHRSSSVKVMTGKVTKVLMAYRASALEKLNTLDLKSFGAQQRGLVDLIFNPQKFGADLFDELKHPIQSALQSAGNEMMRELGMDDPWKLTPTRIATFLGQRQQPVQECGETVRARLNDELLAGYDAGETMQELSDRVRGVFNDLGKVEATRIARTETNIAYNDQRHDTMEGAGVAWKSWLSSHGPHVRPAHAAAELTYSVDSPIPIDQPFRVGEELLMFPGDDSLGATAGNIINCQCIVLAVKPKGGKTWEVCGLGEMEFQTT